MRLKPSLVGLIAALVNVFFWGIAPAVIKFGLETISPFVFLYYRFVIVVALTTPILLIFRKRYNTIRTPKELFRMLGIGLLTNPLTLGILFVGLQYTTSAAAAILVGLAPLFVVFASGIFLKEKITRFEILGSILASIGTIVIVLDTPTQAHASNPFLGNSLILLSNLVWTGGVLAMKKMAHKHQPFLFGYTGWFTGMIVFAIAAAITDPIMFARPLMLTQLPDALWAVIYMAVFGSIVAFTAYQVAQKYLTASHVSIFAYLEPIIAFPLSYFWLKEKFGGLFLLGSLVLLVGVILAEIHPQSRFHTLRKNFKHHKRS